MLTIQGLSTQSIQHFHRDRKTGKQKQEQSGGKNQQGGSQGDFKNVPGKKCFIQDRPVHSGTSDQLKGKIPPALCQRIVLEKRFHQ